MHQEGLPNPALRNRPVAQADTPGRAAVTFLLCAVWFTVALVIVGLLVHGLAMTRPGFGDPIVAPLFNLLLPFAGLLLIARVRVPELRPLSAVGLVRRATAGREVGLGAAVGWAVGLLLVLPGVLAKQMHSSLALDGAHFRAAAASVCVLFLFVMARQIVLCGLPFRSLARATSPAFASVAFAGVAALLVIYTVRGDVAEALLAAMAQLVFGMAAARTRAIWLGSALQFAWGLTITVLFGLPSFLWPPATGVVETRMSGPRWLTGNLYGPEATLWAGLVVLAVLIVVWRLTRDYAWHYTFDPISAAGYPMDVPPPAEHTRMEQAAAEAGPLVQIGGVAPVADGSAPSRNELGEGV